jgi:zinc/manganese transport system permease protein
MVAAEASRLSAAGPSLEPLSDLRQLTAYPFMVSALEAGTIVAAMAGVIGWFMVLRRQTFAGHTLSVMSFPGAAGALLIGLSAAAGYFLFTAIAALVIGAAAGTQTRRRQHGQEAAITGAVQAFGLACGFLFLSLYQGVLGNYETLLFGSFLGITHGQVLALALVAAVAVALLAIAGRPLLFASLDEGVAQARGVPTRALSLGFLLLLGLAVAETAQITGALLVFALLVAPPATAQALTPRIGLSLALSVLIGVLVTWVGLALAYFYEYPVGFYITTVAFVAYLLARVARALADGPTPFAINPWRANPQRALPTQEGP